MADLKTPILSIVIGEGGSDGALALGVSDHLMMLEFSIYSVISPEGCASILWKKAEKAEEAAEVLGITSNRLKKLGLTDSIIKEPLGGAHRDIVKTMDLVKEAIKKELFNLNKQSITSLLEARHHKLMSFGEFSQ